MGQQCKKEVRIEVHLQPPTSRVFSTVLPNQIFLLNLNATMNQWLHKMTLAYLPLLMIYRCLSCRILSLFQVEFSPRNFSYWVKKYLFMYCLVVPAFWLQLLSSRIQSKSLLSSHLPVHTNTEFGDTSEISHQPSLSWIISWLCCTM